MLPAAGACPIMFTPPNSPPTQRDLARLCGVHPSTICLALANAASIPAATRERIQAAAQQLGYHPNAAARNLVLRRTRRGDASLPLAWINQEPDADFWKTDATARLQYASARQQAEHHGYYLEEFNLAGSGLSLARLVQILRARAIEGVIFPVHRALDAALLQPVWGAFSTISFNDYRVSECLDVVCPNYYYNICLALRQLSHRGRERIGLVLGAHFDSATHGLVRRRYLCHQDEVGLRRLPVCLLGEEPGEKLKQFDAWHRRYRPDAILCRDPALASHAQAHGFAGELAQLQVVPEDGLAGIDERQAEVAAMAVDFVVGKIRRMDKSFGGATQIHLLKGVWHARAALEAAAVA